MLVDKGCDCQAYGGDEAYAAGQTVNAVDHVEGIYEGHNPEDRDEASQPTGEVRPEAGVHAEAKPPGEKRGKHLEDELRASGEAKTVIDEPQRLEYDQRNKQSLHFSWSVSATSAKETEKCSGHASECQQHAQTTAARDGTGVDVPLEVGLVHHSPSGEKPEHQAGQDH